MKRALVAIVSVVVVIAGLALATKTYIVHRRAYAPARPAGIAPDAVYIQGPNGRGLWESCEMGASDIECAIANVSGSILHQGKFIPYRGTSPKAKEDIVITQKSGDGWISLANGTYLIPAEHNEASRRYLDFMVGNAKSF